MGSNGLLKGTWLVNVESGPRTHGICNESYGHASTHLSRAHGGHRNIKHCYGKSGDKWTVYLLPLYLLPPPKWAVIPWRAANRCPLWILASTLYPAAGSLKLIKVASLNLIQTLTASYLAGLPFGDQKFLLCLYTLYPSPFEEPRLKSSLTPSPCLYIWYWNTSFLVRNLAMKGVYQGMWISV